ncbi:MAG: DUF1272 domain-containing protein [Myxococcales bacterium]|jgi:hypothetical protein|nr:MAG: DUF1272 domain-containing protein [Myxococcales bacterium]
MLKMKPDCEKCAVALGAAASAFICSYECTFCENCTQEMSNVCPNCGGELVRRPARERGPVDVVTSQVKQRMSRLFGRDA